MGDDPFQREFVAQLLRSEAPAIAARAATVMGQIGAQGHWGADSHLAWREALESRVQELASSIGVGCPDELARRAAWARVAFEARGANVADLVLSLRALKRAAIESVPSEDSALVASALDGAIQAAESPAREPPPELSADAPHGRLAARYLLALLEGDRLRAARLVHDEVGAGRIGVPEVYRWVFMPVLRELGRMWHLGEVNVAEEHFATATTLAAMSQLAPLATRKPETGRALLAATVSGNAHEVGVRMVADRFEWEGWRVVYLGPSVPPEDLAQATVDFGVDAVALSVALTVQLDALDRAVSLIRSTAPGVLVIAGGAGLGGDEGLARRLGADALASDPDEAVRVATGWRVAGSTGPRGPA